MILHRCTQLRVPSVVAVLEQPGICIDSHQPLIVVYLQLTFPCLCPFPYSKVKDVPPCIEKAMKAKGDAVCNEKDIDYFKKMKEAMKEEMTAVLCGDFDTDTDAKCVGIDLAEMKEDVDDKSLAEAMKKIMDKVL